MEFKDIDYKIKITKRKGMKNITMRVSPDGIVKISACYSANKKDIYSFIVSHRTWIDEQLKKLQERIAKTTLQYVSGEEIKYLGTSYVLSVIPDIFTKIEIDQDEKKIKLYTLYTASREDKEKIMKQWMMNNLYQIICVYTDKYYKLTGLKGSKIKIRQMTTRWGSCNVRTLSITYNFYLIYKPIEAIEYVVLHETAHIAHPDHQKHFWELVEKYMPDRKKRQLLLRSSEKNMNKGTKVKNEK